MASNPRALVARVVEAWRAIESRPPAALTAADYVEGGPRLPLIYLADVTQKGRDMTGQTGTITCTDPTGRGRTVQLSRLTMAEYRLIPDDAVVRITVEVVG